MKHPLRTLLTGLLAVLPLAATVLLLVWTLRFLSAWLGPGSAVGGLLTSIGLGVTESELIGYLLGLLLVVVLIYALGLLVERGLQKGAVKLFETLLKRIPVVRTIYDVAQKLVALFARPEGDDMKSMSPVWLHFGGKKQLNGDSASDRGTAVLGFLSTPEPVLIGGQPYLGVLVPTAPVPVGGGLLYVPPDWVESADIGMEAVTSIYVSMGVTSDQYLRPQNPRGSSPTITESR
ncbi:MAG: DUF502 domain-containing protein [Betaproteobacteria bacterium]|nr:MAG: DUF502 domain-containing protein [Betaproteobacteria bacterium]